VAGVSGPEFFTGDSDSPDDSVGAAVAEQPLPLRESHRRPVLVTGAAGMVGTHLCRELVKSGWRVRALVRDSAKAVSRLGHLDLETRVGDIRDSDAMRSAADGCGSVIHLAAIAIEKSGESYEATNADATAIVLDAANAAGIDRIIHMSQNGADSESPHPFLRSKGIAEDRVKSSTLHWTVFRPSVIFGPEDEFVNVLGRLVRLSPVVFPLPGGGTARFQPISVYDVAKVVCMSLEDQATVGATYSLGGSTPLTLRQMTERILIAMHASRILVSVPVKALRPVVGIAQAVLPRPPVTTGLLDLLEMDNVVPDNSISDFDIEPVPFAPEELLYLRKITVGSALRSLCGR
jgi:NADH dehydrogenase